MQTDKQALDAQTASEISLRIASLENLLGDELKYEMQSLKKSLIENPSACLLLQPEDVGLLVSNLRKITGQAMASASKEKATKAKSKKLTAQELNDALNSDEF